MPRLAVTKSPLARVKIRPLQMAALAAFLLLPATPLKELKSLFNTDHDEIVKLKAENDSLRMENAKFEAYMKAHP